MDALAYLKQAATVAKPYVPLFQVSSSSVTTLSWIWKSTPTGVKLGAVVLIVAFVVFVYFKIRKEVWKAKSAFFTSPDVKYQMVSTQAV